MLSCVKRNLSQAEFECEREGSGRPSMKLSGLSITPGFAAFIRAVPLHSGSEVAHPNYANPTPDLYCRFECPINIDNIFLII